MARGTMGVSNSIRGTCSLMMVLLEGFVGGDLAFQRRGSRSQLINGGTISCFGNWFAFFAGRLQPRFPGALHFFERLIRRLAKGGASLQIGKIGNVSAIFLAVEDVDVI